MAGGGTKTTQTQRLDPASQYYVNQTRDLAGQGTRGLMGVEGSLYQPESMSILDQAMPFMNPWFQQVLDPVNASFDRAREMSRMGVNDSARGAGAFGSARHGVAEAVGMGEIEQGRAQVLGNLLNGQWQNAVTQGMGYQAQQAELARMAELDPYIRAQMGIGLRNSALGPTGTNQTTVQKTSPNVLGQVAGLGLGVAGALMPGGAAGAGGGGLTGYGALSPSGGGPAGAFNGWGIPNQFSSPYIRSSFGPGSQLSTPYGGWFNF